MDKEIEEGIKEYENDDDTDDTDNNESDDMLVGMGTSTVKKDSNRCKSIIQFGDDYGDNSTTFHCQLDKGHNGPHQEKGDMSYKEDYTEPYTLEWEDEHENKI